jgi:formate hydrogenlyase subunit 6/NADH:ubiquinone oxidoreductase subunit I
MATTAVVPGARFVADEHALAALLSSLARRGYQTIGPKVRDGAVVYDVIEKLQDLPLGWTDEQEPGRYRLDRRGDQTHFAYAVGPHSWKRFLHPPEVRLFQVERKDQGLRVLNGSGKTSPKFAFLGVRACELAAIAIQDRVFLGDRYVEPHYKERREKLFLVAVQCTAPSSTCFCTSMGSGPAATGGFDVALTEVPDGGAPFYVMEAATELGAEVLAELDLKEASQKQVRQADEAVRHSASSIRRRIETKGLREALYAAFDHPRWEEVAKRCLACANCTQACPTCFCTTVEDTSDVAGECADRWRKWDSCFVQTFSYIHGGSVRMSPKSRYRQWLTHKLAAWVDQFGTSGCVGCGRCITWCPAGIDITEEVAAICGSDAPEPVKGE